MLELLKTFLTSIPLTISIYIFGIIIFNKGKIKVTIKDIILIFIACILQTLDVILLKGTAKTIVLMLIFAGLLKLSFNTGYLKSIFSSIIYMMLLIIPDLLVLGVITQILKISKEYCYSTFAGSVLGNVSVSILMIGLIYILRKPLRKIFSYRLSRNKEIVATSLLTLITIAVFFYILIKDYKISNNIFVYILAIFTLTVILGYLFKEKIKNENMFKRHDDLLTVMKNYESDIEEHRTATHETRNELLAIRSRVSELGDEKLCEYIDSILGDKKNINSTKYSKFKYLPTNGLKGFLYYKFVEAEEQGLDVRLNIAKQIEKSFLANLNTNDFKDLTRVLGVYLDNAIEASALSEKKQLGIEIYKINNDIEVIISNTYDNDKLDKNKIGKERYSTKSSSRGHGLLLAKRTLKNNDRLKSETKVTDTIYCQIVKIKEK